MSRAELSRAEMSRVEMSRADSHESDGGETSLTTRLDPAIAEASTGIGRMMSELVRRSLRSGVAEIDETLHSFATEQVEVAVERKMVEVTEVAESTSRRVSEAAVRRAAEKTEQISELLTSSLNSAVDRLESQLGETRRRTEETGLTLQELRTKAKHSWKKFVAELETIQGAEAALRQELAEARDREVVLRAELKRLAEESSQQQQRLLSVGSRLEMMNERLAEIERPKGLNALLQRIRGIGKSATPSAATPDAATPSAATPDLPTSDPPLPGKDEGKTGPVEAF